MGTFDMFPAYKSLKKSLKNSGYRSAMMASRARPMSARRVWILWIVNLDIESGMSSHHIKGKFGRVLILGNREEDVQMRSYGFFRGHVVDVCSCDTEPIISAW